MSDKELGGLQWGEGLPIEQYIDAFHEAAGYGQSPPGVYFYIGRCHKCHIRIGPDDNPVIHKDEAGGFLMHSHCSEMTRNAKKGVVYPGDSR